MFLPRHLGLYRVSRRTFDVNYVVKTVNLPTWYSASHDMFLAETIESINRQGPLNLQKCVAISVDGFLDLLVFYLKLIYVILITKKYIYLEKLCVGWFEG